MTNKTLYLNSSFETKALKKGSKSLKIAGYANTTAKDRSGDVVTAEAWAKGVENFRRNPVMLYQHKHDTPIGRIDKIQVDKKGIFVEGSVSEAAEKIHGIQTLIKDGALKSFSVGFRVKDGKYNREDDSMTITDVELLEISVVSVPCNQDSLFSIRKSFDSEQDYKEFVTSIDAEVSDDEQKMMNEVTAGITSVVGGHYHTVELDASNNGVTTYASHMSNHAHRILNGVVQSAGEPPHTHDITMMGVPILNMESEEIVSERPLSPTEEEAMSQAKDTIEDIDEKTELEVEIKTDVTEDTVEESIEIKAESDVEEKAEEIEVKEEEEEELVIRDANEEIPMINLLSVDTENLQHNDLVNYNEKMFRVVKLATAQSPIFKFLEIDSNGKDCDNVLNVNADELSSPVETKTQIGEDKDSNESLTKELHNNSDKENEPMADQVVDTIDLEVLKAEANIETKAAPVATVSEPQVAQLVEKTGEAIIKESDAQEKAAIAAKAASEEVAELKSQMAKYQDEIKALQTSKMQFQENSRSTAGAQFSEREMANAVMLSKMLNKRDAFDTKVGSRMKAVTTVDQFLSNFSSNIYTEMEQQLIVAPMFTRMSVDARNFRVPVADEDTDGDVAMFESGTFSTGIADMAHVPLSNQNTIKSVDFTPHKFMATTHLAKDEEEDTVLPLIDFLRAAATRRLARSIDKSILRGTGALAGFNQAPAAGLTRRTGMPSVIKGVCAMADGLIEVATGGAVAATPTHIASARSALGKYGLQLGNDLVYVTSVEGYNSLVQTADFQTVDTFGPNATYLTGSVGAIYGIPIAISEFLDTRVGAAAGMLGVLIYKPGFMIAERRGIEIESEYEPRQQVTAMYMSTRFDFKALTTNANAALDTTKYPYACTVRSQ